MSNKEPNNSKDHQHKAEEPETAFKKVQFFDSFEEQEKAELQWLASQTPTQHLEHTVSLIKRIFAEELKQRPEIGNQLYFD